MRTSADLAERFLRASGINKAPHEQLWYVMTPRINLQTRYKPGLNRSQLDAYQEVLAVTFRAS